MKNFGRLMNWLWTSRFGISQSDPFICKTDWSFQLDFRHPMDLVPLGVESINCFGKGRAIAQAVSRWLPTAAVRGSKPDLGMWDLWWDKVALGRFSPSTSVSPAIVVRSTNYSAITLIYHPGKMYNRPMCGRSTGAYTNLGDLQRDLMGVKSHPTK
jgi:hypothetical protein